MGYKQANKIFPADLLNEIQNYVDGQYGYIPAKTVIKECGGKLIEARK